MSILSKYKGNLSFVFVLAGLFAATVLRYLFPEFVPGILIVLQTGFEAGTVGGAADWLAVKMIFDEIRIGKWKIVPASGIIPRKQMAIAQGAGKLVATEWLTPGSIQKMLRHLDAAQFLAGYLETWHRSGESRKVFDWLLDHIQEWLARPATREKLTEVSREFLQNVRISQWLARHGSEEKIRTLLDALIPYACEKTANLLTTREAFDLIHSKLAEEQDSFFKKILFDPEEATEKTILKATVLLREIQFDESHPIRVKIHSAVASWCRQLAEDGREAREFDAVASGILESVPLDSWVSRVTDEVHEYLDSQRKPDSLLQTIMGQWIEEAIGKLRTDSSWRETVNEKIISAAGTLMASHHHKIAELVEENLRSLSPEQIKEQFRSRTYDDMQWIRVNGAVAGFGIGLVIGLARWLGGW